MGPTHTLALVRSAYNDKWPSSRPARYQTDPLPRAPALRSFEREALLVVLPQARIPLHPFHRLPEALLEGMSRAPAEPVLDLARVRHPRVRVPRATRHRAPPGLRANAHDPARDLHRLAQRGLGAGAHVVYLARRLAPAARGQDVGLGDIVHVDVVAAGARIRERRQLARQAPHHHGRDQAPRFLVGAVHGIETQG